MTRRDPAKVGLGSFVLGALAFPLAVALVVSLGRAGFEVLPPKSSWDEIRLAPLSLALPFIVASAFLRSVRVRWLFPPRQRPGMRPIVAIELLGQLAALALPFRLGEFVRPTLYRTRCGVPTPRALSIAFVDRILEATILFVLLVLALLLGETRDPLPTHLGAVPIPTRLVRTTATTAAIGFSALTALLFLLHRLGNVGERLSPLGSSRIPAVAALFRRVSDAVVFVPTGPDAIRYTLASVGYWLASAAGLVCLAHACGIEGLDLTRAVATNGIIALGLVLPSTPGYVGTYQAGFAVALAMFFAEPTVVGPGTLLVAVSYGTMWIGALGGAGIAALLAAPLSRTEVRAGPSDESK